MMMRVESISKTAAEIPKSGKPCGGLIMEDSTNTIRPPSLSALPEHGRVREREREKERDDGGWADLEGLRQRELTKHGTTEGAMDRRGPKEKVRMTSEGIRKRNWVPFSLPRAENVL